VCLAKGGEHANFHQHYRRFDHAARIVLRLGIFREDPATRLVSRWIDPQNEADETNESSDLCPKEDSPDVWLRASSQAWVMEPNSRRRVETDKNALANDPFTPAARTQRVQAGEQAAAYPPAWLAQTLKVESNLTRKCSRRNVVSAAERGQEVVKPIVVRQIDDAELRAPSATIPVE
jgi:hypothetical protein